MSKPFKLKQWVTPQQALDFLALQLGERVDLIEHQLAHAVKDANGRAYNRTAHLPARKAMMQRWADSSGQAQA